MTVSAVAFYPVAGLVVVTAAAAVLMPDPRGNVAGALGLSAATAILCLVSGADLLALAVLAVPALTAGVLLLAVVRSGQARVLRRRVLPVRRRPTAALAGGLALVLLWTMASNSGGWRVGQVSARLLDVLRHQAPVAAAGAAALLAVAVAGALVVGRVSDDERAFDREQESRRQRQERVRRQREDRAAARRSRGRAGEPAGGERR